MINTYNESHLHHTLKTMYALEYEGKTEVPLLNFICDIVTPDGLVIEIQTANISKLKEKVSILLKNGHKVLIVHPICTVKTVKTFSQEGTLISTRKSPKSETLYSLPRELTGIWPVLGNPNLTLEILFVKITENRKRTEGKTQLKNKSRRHLKDWIPLGKTLDEISGKRRLCTKEDYLNLIPAPVGQNFTIPELTKTINSLPEMVALSATNKKRTSKEARLLIWLLKKMNLVKETGTSGRAKTYSLIR